MVTNAAAFSRTFSPVSAKNSAIISLSGICEKLIEQETHMRTQIQRRPRPRSWDLPAIPCLKHKGEMLCVKLLSRTPAPGPLMSQEDPAQQLCL